MLINLSPFTFLFSSLYITILIYLPSVSSFLLFWFLIELIMLLYIGVAYSCCTNLVSHIIIFFLAQTLSSFLILFSYLTSSPYLIALGIIFNLGIFPLSSWFIYSVVPFPSFLLYLSATAHKLPILILIMLFPVNVSFELFMLALSLNILLIGCLALSSLSLRYLLVSSSVSNNSWFILGQQAGVNPLLFFCSLYFFFLGYVLFSSSISTSVRPYSHPANNYSVVSGLATLSGLPPSPLFFSNVFILLALPYSVELVVFVLSSVPLVCSYIIFSIQFFTTFYNRS